MCVRTPAPSSGSAHGIVNRVRPHIVLTKRHSMTLTPCTLCKSLVMTRQGSRNRWVTGCQFGRDILAYSTVSVLYSSSRMKIPNIRRPRSLPITDIAWERSGRVLDSRPRGRGFDRQRRNCVVALSKNINPS